MAKKIERRESDIHGSGVFAKKKIKKGEPIVQYKGKLITHEEAITSSDLPILTL